MSKPNITHTILGQYVERCELLQLQLAQAIAEKQALATELAEYKRREEEVT